MEKLLATSNFSFSHSVFKRLVRQTSKNQCLCLENIKMMGVYLSIYSIAGNGEHAKREHFLHFRLCFDGHSFSGTLYHGAV